MPGESGLDIVKALRESDSTISIIVLTGSGSIATAIEAVRRGADHYLSKPVDVDQILAAYETANATKPTDSLPPATVPTLARVNGSTFSAFYGLRGKCLAGLQTARVAPAVPPAQTLQIPTANLKWLFWQT